MGSPCDQPLHGFTVVVDTPGPMLYIGRFHSETEEGIVLSDVDAREHGSASAKAEYLARSAKYGVFKNTDHVRIPRDQVASVRRLIEYARPG